MVMISYQPNSKVPFWKNSCAKRDSEKERERVSMCGSERECVCVWVRERESVRVDERVCVCVGERECVYVWVREREKTLLE